MLRGPSVHRFLWSLIRLCIVNLSRTPTRSVWHWIKHIPCSWVMCNFMPLSPHFKGHFLIAFDVKVTVLIWLCVPMSLILFCHSGRELRVNCLCVPRLPTSERRSISHWDKTPWPSTLSLYHFSPKQGTSAMELNTWIWTQLNRNMKLYYFSCTLTVVFR